MLFDASFPPLLAALVRHYDDLVDHVRRQMTRFGGDHRAAREVVHEVCVELIERPAAEPVHTPLAFLRAVSSRRAIDRHRADGRRAAWQVPLDGADDDVLAGPMADDPQRIAAARQQLAALTAAIQGLPPRCRDVFVMHKVHECPQAEVAHHLGISLKTVEKHVRLGMAACRAALDDARPGASS